MLVFCRIVDVVQVYECYACINVHITHIFETKIMLVRSTEAEGR
jgi:hypothetical protein